MNYIIADWTGNILLNGQDFPTFEDAWDYILGELTDKLGLTEEDYQEYFVEEKLNIRATKYLEPNDPRNGYVTKGT